jgi:5-methyltetrahydrofolate--homocysteine methyltransferase
MHEIIELIKETAINGKHKEIGALVKSAIDQGIDLDKIINDGFIAAMDIVGEKFAKCEIFIPEMLIAAKTTKAGLSVIKPLLKGTEYESKDTILMGTVKGDLHDIGKDLVIMMLEGAGFKVVDMGVDVGVKKIIEQIEKVKPSILGLSALLSTTVPQMKVVLDALEQNGLRANVKVMIGGAAVNASYVTKIGADGFGANATEAVALARSFRQKAVDSQ